MEYGNNVIKRLEENLANGKNKRHAMGLYDATY